MFKWTSDFISFDEHPEIVEVLPIQQAKIPLPTANCHTEDSFKLQDWTAINENIVSSPKQENKRWGFLKLHSLKPTDVPHAVNDPSCRPPLACWQNRTSADLLWRCIALWHGIPKGAHSKIAGFRMLLWGCSFLQHMENHQVFTPNFFRWWGQVALIKCASHAESNLEVRDDHLIGSADFSSIPHLFNWVKVTLCYPRGVLHRPIFLKHSLDIIRSWSSRWVLMIFIWVYIYIYIYISLNRYSYT